MVDEQSTTGTGVTCSLCGKGVSSMYVIGAETFCVLCYMKEFPAPLPESGVNLNPLGNVPCNCSEEIKKLREEIEGLKKEIMGLKRSTRINPYRPRYIGRRY